MKRIFKAKCATSWYFFLVGLVLGSWAAMIPAIKENHGLNNGLLGGLMCAVVFGAVLAIPVVTYSIKKYGSAISTRVSGILSLLMLPMLGLNENLGIFVVAMVLLGFCSACQDVSMNSQAVLCEKDTGQHILGLFTAIFATGCLIGALIAGVILGPFNRSVFEATVILSSIFLLPTALFGLWLFDYEEEMKIADQGSDMSTSLLAGPGLALTQDTKLVEPDNFSLIVTSLLCFLGYFGEGSVGDWSAIYLVGIGASPLECTFGFISFQLVVAIGRYYSDSLVAHIGRKSLLFYSGIISAFGLSLVTISTYVSEHFLVRFIISIFGFSVCGVGLCVVYPTVISYAGSNIKGISSADAIAYVSSAGYIGVMVGPPLIGTMSLLIGLKWAFFMDAILMLLVTILSHTCMKEESQKVEARN